MNGQCVIKSKKKQLPFNEDISKKSAARQAAGLTKISAIFNGIRFLYEIQIKLRKKERKSPINTSPLNLTRQKFIYHSHCHFRTQKSAKYA